MIREQPPRHPEAQVVTGRYGPQCGACGGQLAHKDTWRCPYVRCRTWLRGAIELEAEPSIV